MIAVKIDTLRTVNKTWHIYLYCFVKKNIASKKTVKESILRRLWSHRVCDSVVVVGGGGAAAAGRGGGGTGKHLDYTTLQRRCHSVRTNEHHADSYTY